MFTLLDALLKNPLANPSIQLQSRVKKTFLNNLRLNNRLCSTIPLKAKIQRIARNDDFVAVLDVGNQLSLYSIRFAHKIWSIKLPSMEDYLCVEDGLMVSDTGSVVLKLYYNVELNPDLANMPFRVWTYNGEGRVVAFEMVDVSYLGSTLRVISNRIFCISQTDDEVYFVEWDFQGNERRRVLVSELISSNGMIEVNISDNHYLAFLKFRAGLKKCTVFTFNFETNQHQLRQIQFRSYPTASEVVVSKMVKIGDVLVCGVHFVKSNDPNQARSENPFDPSIFIFNTLTHNSQSYEFAGIGFISDLVANKNYIAFVIGEFTVRYIDLRKERDKKIIYIPQAKLMLEGEILCVFHGSESNLRVCLFDLDRYTYFIQASSTYENIHEHSIFFRNYTIVVPNSETSLKIETFRHLQGNTQEHDPQVELEYDLSDDSGSYSASEYSYDSDYGSYSVSSSDESTNSFEM